MKKHIRVGVISDTHGLVRPEALAALRGEICEILRRFPADADRGALGEELRKQWCSIATFFGARQTIDEVLAELEASLEVLHKHYAVGGPEWHRVVGRLRFFWNASSGGLACKICGCSEYDPCDDGPGGEGETCSWAGPNLCSKCALMPGDTAAPANPTASRRGKTQRRPK